jgi:hypothetical protein
MRAIRWTLALAAVMALGITTAAQAAPITFGSTLTSPFEAGVASGGSGTFANFEFGEPGAKPTSPVTGAIINWRVADANGPFRLRVLRPSGAAYTAVASSPTELAVGGPGSGIQTFAAAVPIQAGDLIGVDINNGNKIGIHTGDPADFAAVWIPPIADGATLPPFGSENEIEVAYNATVQPAPTLTAISPASGSIKGGTAVTVAGTDLANVSGVSFGGVPAASFVVPQLKGKKLKAAKKKLRKASCKVGKVKFRGDATAKTGKVVKQAPKPRKQLAPGSKVNVTLG